MSVLTIEEVKTLLQITGNQFDSYLSAMLPLVEEYVAQYCNRDFKDTNGIVVYPGGVKIAISKLCQSYMRESGLQSESLARHSVTFETSAISSDITAMLNSYRRPHFV